MIKRAIKQEYKPIELVNFIHDQQEQRLKKENPPKKKKLYRPRKKKIFIDPNQMSLDFCL